MKKIWIGITTVVILISSVIGIKVYRDYKYDEILLELKISNGLIRDYLNSGLTDELNAELENNEKIMDELTKYM